MKKHHPHHHVQGTGTHKTREARTGEHCPVDGWWAPAGREADQRYIAQGSVLPAHDGDTVTWIFVARRSDSRQPKYALPAAGAFIDNF
ncbi:hypothetical protein [Arthrobacter sp. 35/47]|uniref:hypothetical protein n=1 Tax=Arthrobacter sp. 35/47 TaxID=269454 RepID=UPI0004B4F763|nr:hypothetical protein [Arthrobacter sp. 35/47]